jgi:hypothetical protein
LCAQGQVETLMAATQQANTQCNTAVQSRDAAMKEVTSLQNSLADATVRAEHLQAKYTSEKHDWHAEAVRMRQETKALTDELSAKLQEKTEEMRLLRLEISEAKAMEAIHRNLAAKEKKAAALAADKGKETKAAMETLQEELEALRKEVSKAHVTGAWRTDEAKVKYDELTKSFERYKLRAREEMMKLKAASDKLETEFKQAAEDDKKKMKAKLAALRDSQEHTLQSQSETIRTITARMEGLESHLQRAAAAEVEHHEAVARAEQAVLRVSQAASRQTVKALNTQLARRHPHPNVPILHSALTRLGLSATGETSAARLRQLTGSTGDSTTPADGADVEPQVSLVAVRTERPQRSHGLQSVRIRGSPIHGLHARGVWSGVYALRARVSGHLPTSLQFRLEDDHA